MPYFQLVIALPDGILAISSRTPARKETWRLRYARSPEKILELLQEIRDEAPHDSRLPAHIPGIEYKASLMIARDGYEEDVDYEGLLANSIHFIIQRSSELNGPPVGVMEGSVPDLNQQDCFTTVFPATRGVGGICLWVDKASNVALFFTRPQGFRLLKKLTFVPKKDLDATRRGIREELLPEHSSQSVIQFSGRAAQLIVAGALDMHLHNLQIN